MAPTRYGAGLDEVAALLDSLGEPRYRARQVWDGLYRRRAPLEDLTDVGRPLTDLMAFDSEYFLARINREDQRIQYRATQWLIVAALGRLSELADAGRPLVSAVIGGEGQPSTPGRPKVSLTAKPHSPQRASEWNGRAIRGPHVAPR